MQIDIGIAISVVLLLVNIIIGLVSFGVRGQLKTIHDERSSRDTILKNLSDSIYKNTLEVSNRLTKIETNMESSVSERHRVLQEIGDLNRSNGSILAQFEGLREKINSLEQHRS